MPAGGQSRGSLLKMSLTKTSDLLYRNPWGISKTWMFTWATYETVLCVLYFGSVSFDGRSAGGRRAMGNFKIIPLEYRNLDLTNLICNAASRLKVKFSCVFNYEFKSCHLHNSHARTVKNEVVFNILPMCVQNCFQCGGWGGHSQKNLLCFFPGCCILLNTLLFSSGRENKQGTVQTNHLKNNKIDANGVLNSLWVNLFIARLPWPPPKRATLWKHML